VGCLGFAFAGGGGGAAVGLFSDEGGGGGGPVFRTELVVEDGLALGVKDGVELVCLKKGLVANGGLTARAGLPTL
jgi:hypothetical protein